jgi:hypothetical protein
MQPQRFLAVDSATGKAQKWYWCDVCDVKCKNCKSYRQHLLSRKHQSKAKAAGQHFSGGQLFQFPLRTVASKDGVVNFDSSPQATAVAGKERNFDGKGRTQGKRFSKWLWDTYGDHLRKGSGVLDIAGGSGQTAFELCCRYGVPCTVVDPRPIAYNQKQKRLLQHRLQMFADLHPNSTKRDEREHEGDNAGGTEAKETKEDSVTADASKPVWKHKFSELEVAQGSPCTPVQLCTLFDELFVAGESPCLQYEDGRALRSGDTAALWKTCSVVIGMHPDEATDAIGELRRTIECCL